jgi:CDP-6-deoxy-D-xylo-4-hexulose-3-dehydrase
MSPDELKAAILAQVRAYADKRHARAPFIPGQTPVAYAGRVFGADEVVAGVSSMLDFWLTLGPEGERMEAALEQFLGVKKTILVNSGSSANLVAFSSLMSPKLGERRILPGDEVITTAAGFPTTVAPIIQAGAVPVFIDSDPETGNARVEMLPDAFVPGKTKAVMMAHTLGNPFDLSAVTAFCQAHDLWLIEDNCDALGARWDGALTGTFGDLSTQSFYPPHHITMGEGGAVNVVREKRLKVIVESVRDWGRDCWCASGQENTCGKRYGWRLGGVPEGYDHKYIYSHLGYNLKPLDIQAAIGCVQMGRLPAFVAARRANWAFLRSELDDLGDILAFMSPCGASGWDPTRGEHQFAPNEPRSEPSWFGFQMRFRERATARRAVVVQALDRAKIGHRMLFGGNLTRQPAFVSLLEDQAQGLRTTAFRVAGDLSGADVLMDGALFVGVAPNQTPETLRYQADIIRDAVQEAVRVA